LEPAPIEDGIVYPEPSDSPTMDTRQGSFPARSPGAMQPSVFPSLGVFSVGGGLARGPLWACLPPHHHIIPSPAHRQQSSGAVALLCLLPFLSPAGLPGSEFQVQAPIRAALGRVYPCSRSLEKHSPDSACSVDYSSSRLSSPEHPNEGETAAQVWGPKAGEKALVKTGAV
jgi:hypothetical protein